MNSEIKYAFKVEHVQKKYHLGTHDIHVLRDIDMDVQCGEWVSLIGPSGSGKTTLLHLLGTLDVPDSGTISFLGIPHLELSARDRTRLRRDSIGLVFQNYYLFPELSALENAALPAFRWGIDRRQGARRAEELLAEFGLQERLNHRPAELSGGEQQRVAMARALINNPRIILADEPTGNLDAEAAAHIMDILRELHQSQGKTVVMVTHDSSLGEYAERTLVLKNGHIKNVHI